MGSAEHRAEPSERGRTNPSQERASEVKEERRDKKDSMSSVLVQEGAGLPDRHWATRNAAAKPANAKGLPSLTW